MRIFTVRHGQTHWNVEGRVQGHSDIPLDEVGLAQAERLALRLADEKIDVIYTSDLLRATKTAEIINTRHNVELVRADALREVNFGIYEGRLFSEVYHEMQQIRATGQTLPEGEGQRAFFGRIHNFLGDIMAKNHENIVIVGHYGTVRAVMCYLLEVGLEDGELFEIGNTALHCFRRGENGEFKMEIDNDTSHLEGIL